MDPVIASAPPVDAVPFPIAVVVAPNVSTQNIPAPKRYSHKKIVLGVFLILVLILVSLGVLHTLRVSLMRFSGITISNQEWVRHTVSGPREYLSIASSADGMKIAVLDSTGTVYTSIDGGEIWTGYQVDAGHLWSSITSSPDGATLEVVNANALIWISKDSGATWARSQSRAPCPNCTLTIPTTASVYGTRLVAIYDIDGVKGQDDNGDIYDDGEIYYSEDSGANWSNNLSAGLHNWRAVALSADGTKVVAASRNIFTITIGDDGWVERDAPGSRDWKSVASSVDGKKLVAVATGSYIWTSTDGGDTWIDQKASGARNWVRVTSSFDGMRIAAVVQGGDIWTSKDGGATWTNRIVPGPHDWESIASSQDGTKLIASVEGSGGYVYTSINSGDTWTGHAPFLGRNASSTDYDFTSILAVTSSADGMKLSLALLHSGIWTSNDGGVTWTDRVAAGKRSWESIASSADGTKLVAAADHIYTSTDSGLTWTDRISLSDERSMWKLITSSADGTKLTAVASNYPAYDDIYSSTDSGNTWVKHTTLPTLNSIASSADGMKLAAVSYNSTRGSGDGAVYTSTDGGATWKKRIVAGRRNWQSITSSADGTMLAAVTRYDDQLCCGGDIWTSADGGATWTHQVGAGKRIWKSITSSADGYKLTALEEAGDIWTTDLSQNSSSTTAPRGDGASLKLKDAR